MKKLTLLTVVFIFTFSINAQKAIQEFDFNGTFINVKNDVSFFGNATFVSDRNGIPNSAIRVVNSSIEATVLNLPVANSSRTVSVWVKYNDVTKANNVWGYGSSYNARFFGLIQKMAVDCKSDLYLAGYGAENDVIVSTEVVPDTWYNYIVTYDGLISKIYRNSELIKSVVSPRKLTSGITFSIGKMGASLSINADIDDLKIYDVALSEVEVTALYKGDSSLSPKNIVAHSSKIEEEKNVSVVPIAEAGARSSEIYSTKGIKVFQSTTNTVDLSSIVEGTYLLQISTAKQSSNGKKTASTVSKITEATAVNVPVKSSEIYSVKGSKVFAGNTNVIDVSSIPEGDYSLKIANTAQSSIAKTLTAY